MEEWKVGDWLGVSNPNLIEAGEDLSVGEKYQVIGIDYNDGTPVILDDAGDELSFYIDEMEYIRKVESPMEQYIHSAFVEPKINNERLVEILTNVSEQQAEELLFKEKRIKLLEEELLATKTRYLKLATQFDVKAFKDLQ